MAEQKQAVDEIICEEHGEYWVVTENYRVVHQTDCPEKAERFCDRTMNRIFDTWCNVGNKWYSGIRVVPEALQLKIVKAHSMPF